MAKTQDPHSGKIIKKNKAQGTIEYLVILAMIVLVGLIIVNLSFNSTPEIQRINSNLNKISKLSSTISITESGVSEDGNYFLKLRNNTGKNVTLKIINIDGSIISEDLDKMVPISSGQLIVLNSNDFCSEGQQITKKVTITYFGANGFEKTQTYPTNIYFKCGNYQIATNYIDENGELIDPFLFSCVGSVPNNANFCIGDDSGLSQNIDVNVVDSCSSSLCEYACEFGYVANSGVCEFGFEQIAKLYASDGGAGGYLGYPGAMDFDDDLIVIGNSRYDDLGSFSGIVYVFDTSNEYAEIKLTSSDRAAGDQYGFAIAIDNNLIVIGAHGNDDLGSRSGSVYVFDASNGYSETKLTASDGAENDYFGQSVAIDGNLIVIGASNNGDSGSAYVFDASNSFSETKLNSSDGTINDYFGQSVAIDGNLIVIGNYHDEGSFSSSGSVYVFDASNSFNETKFAASGSTVDDQFAESVAIDGNLIIVGAPYDSDLGLNSGSIYIFD
jgi:hypothetical protein